MKNRVLRIPQLLRTPLGRMRFAYDAYYAAWPAVYCVAWLYRRTFGRHKRVVAITGSLGKTTTTRAVFRALGGRGPEPSQFNARTALVHALVVRARGHTHAAIEVGISRAGQMAAYARMLRPDIAVVTSISGEHIRSFGTLAAIRAEKSEMVRSLPATAVAVINGDDPMVCSMQGLTRARVVTFGVGESNNVRASGIELDWPNGTRFTLHAEGEKREVRTRLLGRHMVYPVLAAVAVGLAERFSLDRIVPALETMGPTPARMEPVLLPNGAVVLRDEHKASPETVEAALDVLSDIPARRRIVVLGDLSDLPGGVGPVYRHVGERVARVASLAVFACRSRRNLRPYRSGAVRGGLPTSAIVHARDGVLGIAELLRSELGPGDVVLVKGRYDEHLGRVALALAGRDVRCDVRVCDARVILCDRCPMLERGWRGGKG